MNECNLCQIVGNKAKSMKVYEDDKLLAFLHPKPAHEGHVVLTTKEHIPIVENISDELIGHLFNVASKISSSTFDSLEVHGTNIFVQNGLPAGQTIPHVMVHIIPREENDGINLMWQPKQISEEEMSTIELKIKGETTTLAQKAYEIPPPQEKMPEPAEESPEENYLLKQLRRIP